jgi:hypothetical protein
VAESTRDDFERRLLALVRNFLDEADERNPHGYEIGDFMVLYEVFARVDESEPLEPWSGGVRQGFDSPGISFSSTTSAYWLDEVWLAETLARVRELRRSAGDRDRDAEDTDEL